MKKIYCTRDREAGNIIEWFDALDSAVEAIERYEETDREEGTYTPNFYEIKCFGYEVWSIAKRKGGEGAVYSGDEWLELATNDLAEAIKTARDKSDSNGQSKNRWYEVEIRTQILCTGDGCACSWDVIPFEITEETQIDIASYMRNDIREDIHGEFAPCTPEEFDLEYLRRDPGFRQLMKEMFPLELDLLDALNGGRQEAQRYEGMRREVEPMPFDMRFDFTDDDGNAHHDVLCHATGEEIYLNGQWWNVYRDDDGEEHYGR